MAEEEKPVQVYFGNLHAHTGYSADGDGSPAEAYAHARDVAGIDFLAVTEHDHLLGGSESTREQKVLLYASPWKQSLVTTADRFNEDGRFVAFFGQEYSKGSHVNVFQVPEALDVPAGEFHTLLEWLKSHPDTTGQTAVIQLNHPKLGGPPSKKTIFAKDFGRDDFGDDAGWVKAMGAAASLVEVLNGEPSRKATNRRSPQIMDDFYMLLLQFGFRLGPTGNQDNHHGAWGDVTDTRTAILATELTRPALLEAMRARHTYATEDKNLKLIFRVNGRLCGDILTEPSEEAKISFSIEDPDEPKAAYVVDVYRGEINGPLAEIVATHRFSGDVKDGSIPGVSLNRDGQFLFFRVTQEGGEFPDRAWTAPVWLEQAKPGE